MKKYRIPTKCQAIKEVDGVLYAVLTKLQKVDGIWKIIEILVPLEEIKNV
jgi:hypothetical protein